MLAVAKTPADRFFAYQLQFKPALDAKNDPMLLTAVEGAISTGYLQAAELANLHRQPLFDSPWVLWCSPRHPSSS